MKTLQSFVDILYRNGYKETRAPYQYLCGALEIVEFHKGGYSVWIYVYPTPEFEKWLEGYEGEYEVDYKNYCVSAVKIESPLCNIAGFTDGDTSCIQLEEEPNDYVKHGLDLFEYCLSLQTTNLLKHELKIMKCRIEHLEWAGKNLVPVLEKYDYSAEYDSFFNTENDRDSSNQWITFKHKNSLRGLVTIETDALTGDINIVADGINVSDMYGKNQDEAFDTMLEKVWKENDVEYGYIFSGDPKETVDSASEVRCLWTAIRYKERDDTINFDLIPERYSKDIETYNNLIKCL